MTLDELDGKFHEASWLIARRSTVAAGQALIFNAGSLDDAAEEVATIYGLSEGEKADVQPTHAHKALESVQTAMSSLFGDALGMSAGQAASVAKQAVASGKKLTFLKTLMQAGPKAAKLAVNSGKAASNAAGKGTPWGWIATAAYAVGTGSWFAYNLHAFNIAAYDWYASARALSCRRSDWTSRACFPLRRSNRSCRISLPARMQLGGRLALSGMARLTQAASLQARQPVFSAGFPQNLRRNQKALKLGRGSQSLVALAQNLP